MAYSPKYINIDDVPLHQVPDNYDKDAKMEAIEFAEASLELDVYDGKEIPAEQVVPMVRAAIKQKATCELVKGARDPTETKLGDLADEGGEKADFASSFCDRYDEIVGKINSSDVLEGSGSRTDPYVYSTSDPDIV